MHEDEACFRRLADAFSQLVRAMDTAAVADRQRWIDTWRHALESGESYGVERRVRFKADCDYVRQLEHGRPVRDASGKIVEWIVIATQADENDRLIAELRSSLRRKEQFLMVVAHEMRNPLAPIANALELLARRSDDPAIVATARALIARQVAQLGRLVNDLLELARYEHGQMDLRRNPVDLANVVAAAVETAQPIITARDHQLTTTTDPGATIVDGDEGRLTQVLVNLLINAAKFTDEGGRISLAVEKDTPSIFVKVRDTGIGIAPEMLPCIFDAYIQAEHQREASRGGFGLGLTLARQLVELHGGTLSAQSEGLGKGSEFIMRLPAATSSRHSSL